MLMDSLLGLLVVLLLTVAALLVIKYRVRQERFAGLPNVDSSTWRKLKTTEEIKYLIRHGDQLRVKRTEQTRIASFFTVQSIVIIPACGVDYIKNDIAPFERVYLLESDEDILIPVNSPRTISLGEDGTYSLSNDRADWVGENIEIEIKES